MPIQLFCFCVLLFYKFDCENLIFYGDNKPEIFIEIEDQIVYPLTGYRKQNIEFKAQPELFVDKTLIGIDVTYCPIEYAQNYIKSMESTQELQKNIERKLDIASKHNNPKNLQFIKALGSIKKPISIPTYVFDGVYFELICKQHQLKIQLSTFLDFLLNDPLQTLYQEISLIRQKSIDIRRSSCFSNIAPTVEEQEVIRQDDQETKVPCFINLTDFNALNITCALILYLDIKQSLQIGLNYQDTTFDEDETYIQIGEYINALVVQQLLNTVKSMLIISPEMQNCFNFCKYLNFTTNSKNIVERINEFNQQDFLNQQTDQFVLTQQQFYYYQDNLYKQKQQKLYEQASESLIQSFCLQYQHQYIIRNNEKIMFNSMSMKPPARFKVIFREYEESIIDQVSVKAIKKTGTMFRTLNNDSMESIVTEDIDRFDQGQILSNLCDMEQQQTQLAERPLASRQGVLALTFVNQPDMVGDEQSMLFKLINAEVMYSTILKQLTDAYHSIFIADNLAIVTQQQRTAIYTIIEVSDTIKRYQQQFSDVLIQASRGENQEQAMLSLAKYIIQGSFTQYTQYLHASQIVFQMLQETMSKNLQDAVDRFHKSQPSLKIEKLLQQPLMHFMNYKTIYEILFKQIKPTRQKSYEYIETEFSKIEEINNQALHQVQLNNFGQLLEQLQNGLNIKASFELIRVDSLLYLKSQSLNKVVIKGGNIQQVQFAGQFQQCSMSVCNNQIILFNKSKIIDQLVFDQCQFIEQTPYDFVKFDEVLFQIIFENQMYTFIIAKESPIIDELFMTLSNKNE
ncbi:Dbl_homology (DH) domain superfamily [Hexamita inflata]|uniref:Dbl homology (DH) domain superfamily n=1 Tax=Hexamita inflata TaxID=28002 RepID=A0AA86P0X5_9EUKA|nr:Dbl homology (DH) domain superfamily [Hexamita inflata]